MRVPLEWAAALAERWAVSRADRVISCAAAYSKVEVLSIRAPVFDCRSPARLGDGQITIAYHGRLSPEKAVDATVRAIAAAHPTHDKIRFRIVGAGSLLQSTLSLGHSLGVRIEHVPWCAEPRDHLTTAQIYVTASREETFSISTLEAMGCGLPVIARAVGSIPSYLHHGENGLLFESDGELPDLTRLLVTDENLRLSLGRAARDAAIDKSIWEQFAEASVRNWEMAAPTVWSIHDVAPDTIGLARQILSDLARNNIKSVTLLVISDARSWTAKPSRAEIFGGW
jgi:glycosyltransferase involved in cell wall biosynthesis